MSDSFQTDPSETPPSKIVLPQPALPTWLARRLLRPDEEITWVRGPRWNPEWERYVTHPLLFLQALALGAACIGIGRLSVESWSELPPGTVLAALGIALGSILVLGVCAAYFTRLVVTNFRVVILQGQEVCRCWSLDDLPRSLIRYGKRKGEESSRTVDLDALQTMLGGSSGQFVEAKTILKFGKQLDRFKALERDRPDSDPTRPGG
jgi:hypothetical protein